MKRLTLNIPFAILCLIFVSNSYSQATTNNYGRIDVAITKQKHPKKVYAKAEIKTAFIGGDSAWLQSFEKKLNQSLTINKRAKKGTYIVSAVFVVLKDSSLAEIRALTNVGWGMEETVIRALRKGTLRWTPAAQNGREVRPYRKSAVTYP